MTRTRTAWAGFLFTAITLATARAQTSSYDQFAPKPVPPAPEAPANQAPSVNTVVGAPDETLLPALNGLIFVSRPDEVDARKAKTAEGIQLNGSLEVPAPDAFRAVVTPYLGKPLTRAKLDALITAIIVHYRTHDHPVVDVIMPQQDIAGGVVQVLILESRVGTVTVTGNRWFPTSEIRNAFRIQAGDLIGALRMRSDLEWSNQNPFHTSDVVYQPGKDVGTTDIVVQTQDRFPVRLYASYEDSGNRQTGFDRYLAGFNWGDAWHAGLGHQLNYQYTTGDDFQSLRAHSGSYVIPLPWRHTLTFFGNYVETQGTVPPYLAVKGRSYQISGRYSIPLRPIGEYKHSVGFGFDYKYNRNSLQFGEIPLTTVPVEVRQFALTYDGSRHDRFGITSLNFEGYYSPGNWGGDNSDMVYDQSHSLATAKYFYGNFSVSRLTRLPKQWSLFLKGTAQFSDANLTPSEQIGLGGYDTVRGYDERQLNNDEGGIVNVEVRTPAVALIKHLGWTRWKDQLQFLAFWDWGVGTNHTLLDGEPRNTEISGTGIGLRYSIETNVSVRADYGYQLHKTDLDLNRGSRGDLGVVISY